MMLTKSKASERIQVDLLQAMRQQNLLTYAEAEAVTRLQKTPNAKQRQILASIDTCSRSESEVSPENEAAAFGVHSGALVAAGLLVAQRAR